MGFDPPSVKGRSVLILEDEVFIAFSLRTYLEEAGATPVDLAGSLSEANQKIAEGAYDIAILDMRLPDGEAYELAQSLSDTGVSVVVHSGHATVERNGQMPGVVFCSKPATPQELFHAIGAAITLNG